MRSGSAGPDCMTTSTHLSQRDSLSTMTQALNTRRNAHHSPAYPGVGGMFSVGSRTSVLQTKAGKLPEQSPFQKLTILYLTCDKDCV